MISWILRAAYQVSRVPKVPNQRQAPPVSRLRVRAIGAKRRNVAVSARGRRSRGATMVFVGDGIAIATGSNPHLMSNGAGRGCQRSPAPPATPDCVASAVGLLRGRLLIDVFMSCTKHRPDKSGLGIPLCRMMSHNHDVTRPSDSTPRIEPLWCPLNLVRLRGRCTHCVPVSAALAHNSVSLLGPV